MDKINFENQYKNNNTVNKILKGFKIKFTIKDVIELFSKSNEKLFFLLNEEKNKKYKDVDLDVYLYFILKFINEENLITQNVLSSNIINNIEKVKKMNLIDYGYINYLYNDILDYLSNNKLYSNFDYKIDSILEKNVLQNIPKFYTKIERAIYIYLKLCFLLTYSEDYFICSHTNKQNIVGTSNLEKVISGNGNEIVCFDFCNLFNYFLLEDGNFVYSNVDHYGENDQHEKNIAIIDKYIVFFDSTKSIITGDLTNVKFNKKITGLSLLSSNQVNINKFNLIVERVYKDFQKNNKLPNNTINIYNNLNLLILDLQNIKELSDQVKSKLIKYLYKVYEYYTQTMDFASNCIYKKYDLLTKEDEKIITITLIGKEINKQNKILTILTINISEDDYLYLELENNSIKFIFKEELTQKLNNKEYKLLNNGQCTSFNTIPGINYYDGKRKILK